MKILFLGGNDWANLCNGIARGMNSVPYAKHQAHVWTLNQHPYKYREDWLGRDVGTLKQVQAFVTDLDWLITTGDGDMQALQEMSHLINIPKTAKIAVTHSGSAYRLQPELYNKIDSDIGAKARFVGFDSLALADDAVPTYPYWAAVTKIGGLGRADASAGIQVLHAPSNTGTKGTALISEVFTALDAEIHARRGPKVRLSITSGLSPSQALAAKRAAHIYVDQMNPLVGGFGASAVEAAAAGCAVLSDLSSISPGVWTHCMPPFIHCTDGPALRAQLLRLIEDPQALATARSASLCWADDKRSHERMLDILRVL